MFNKIAKSLKPDGIFIFEPYEWPSYKKKFCFSKEFKNNFKSIKFRPNHFNAYLSNELGLKLIEILNPINSIFCTSTKKIYIF